MDTKKPSRTSGKIFWRDRNRQPQAIITWRTSQMDIEVIQSIRRKSVEIHPYTVAMDSPGNSAKKE